MNAKNPPVTPLATPKREVHSRQLDWLAEQGGAPDREASGCAKNPPVTPLGIDVRGQLHEVNIKRLETQDLVACSHGITPWWSGWLGLLLLGPPLLYLAVALLAGIGLVSAIAQIMMTDAYRKGEASLLAPFEYSAIIWTTALGALIWAEMPDAWDFLGILILVGAGLYIWHREMKLGVKR